MNFRDVFFVALKLQSQEDQVHTKKNIFPNAIIFFKKWEIMKLNHFELGRIINVGKAIIGPMSTNERLKHTALAPTTVLDTITSSLPLDPTPK